MDVSTQKNKHAYLYQKRKYGCIYKTNTWIYLPKNVIMDVSTKQINYENIHKNVSMDISSKNVE
jgi:hypothetical protein